jgi:hypothetical protein
MKLLLCASLLISLQSMAAEMNDAGEIKGLIARHTTTMKASETPNGLVPAMRRIVRSPDHAGIEFNDADLKLISSYRTSDEGRLVIDSFVPVLREALSNKNQISTYEIGQILMEAREAEQQVYREQFEDLIRSLTLDGRTKVNNWLTEAMESITYTKVDLAAVGEAAPSYVIGIAERFTNSIERRAERAALRKQSERKITRQGPWIIISGEGK